MKNLSNEELLKIIEKLKKENKEKEEILKRQAEEIKKLDDKVLRLEAEKKELNIKFEELIAKYENKLAVNRKILADRFAPKTEKIPALALSINEAEVLGTKKRKGKDLLKDLLRN
ncbi:MAG: hypothetical protein NC310_07235 [Roseburia sp.]|nr:hypothetical protein [Anaeroplasma bactoclasticum]MCM1196842.1 hypothetical protein [Roseburia sp.]MCM1557040.1 hypothetical protein [Anaeroplasma bactoclasticum]